MATTEYRLKWRREGRDWVYRIYQTESAVRRKLDGILALEEIKPDTDRWENLPDLVGVPELQVREVDDWVPVDAETSSIPSESARRGVAEWAGVNQGYPYVYPYVPRDPIDDGYSAEDPSDIPF